MWPLPHRHNLGQFLWDVRVKLLKQLKTQPCALAVGEQQARLKRAVVPSHLLQVSLKKPFPTKPGLVPKAAKLNVVTITYHQSVLPFPAQPRCTAEASTTKSPSMWCCFLFFKGKVQAVCCSAALCLIPSGFVSCVS